MSNKTSISGRVLLGAVVALCVIAQSPLANAAEKVKIGVIGILAEAGLYVAAERGYFTKEGLDVEFVKGMFGPDAFPALATGQIDAVGGAFGPEMINAIERGINVRIAGGLSSYVPGFESGFLMVRKELIDQGKVKDFADLKGLKLAILEPRPNLTDYFATQYLRLGGLTLNDVQTVNVPFPSMIAALKTGGVDAAHVSEPLATIAVGAQAAVKFKPVNTYAPNGLTVAMLQFGPNLLEKSRQVGERVIAAYMQGARDYLTALKKPEGRGEMAEILMKYTPVKNRALYDQIVFAYADPDAGVNMEGLQDMATYYGGVLGSKPVDAKALVDTSFAQSALKRLGAYVH
jgi:ABC-type nitrate/sulfonate/bicarbonate transport system substrate-binding protein